MTDPPRFADPVNAANDAIAFYSKMRDHAMAEMRKHERLTNEHLANAQNHLANAQKWAEAKATLTGQEYSPLPDGEINTIIENDEASYVRRAFAEYQRVGQDPETGQEVEWMELSTIQRTAWRSAVALVISLVTTEPEPKVTLGNDHDLAKSAYETWARLMDPNYRDNYPSWDTVNDHTRKVWFLATETIKELLKNQGWYQRNNTTLDLRRASDVEINAVLSERGWKLAYALSSQQGRAERGDIITTTTENFLG